MTTQTKPKPTKKPAPKPPQTSPNYNGGGITRTGLGKPAGMSNRCDNHLRINGPDAPMSQCPNRATQRIVYISGADTHTVKRCPACAAKLERTRHIIRRVELA